MPKLNGITINLGFDDKSILKLRAIAKHAGALADELDAIDNEWSCSYCGHDTYLSYYANDELQYTQCESCNKNVDDELPTRFEGSD